MSRYIATRAIRGANALVTEAEIMLRQGPGRKRAGYAGRLPEHRLLPALDLRHDRACRSKRWANSQTVMQHARDLLHPLPG